MKYALGTTVAIFAILILQFFWLQRMYRSYTSAFAGQMEMCFKQSIEKEAFLRKSSLHKKRLSDSKPIRQDEVKYIIGDSTDIATVKKEKQANSISEGITQLFQMLLLKQGSYPQLDKLDSLYQKDIKEKLTTYYESIRLSKSKEKQIEMFVEVLKKYENIQELDAKLLNELIKQIVVYERELKEDGRTQRIEIEYNFLN